MSLGSEGAKGELTYANIYIHPCDITKTENNLLRRQPNASNSNKHPSLRAKSEDPNTWLSTGALTQEATILFLWPPTAKAL